MNIGSVIRTPKPRTRKPVALCFLICFLPVRNLLAVDPGALKLEEAQRAFQERHQMIFGETVSWPENALGQSAPEYPPDGFYEPDLSNAVQAVALVADLATKFDESGLLRHFTSVKGGDIEGTDGDYGTPPPLLGDKLIMPLPTEVTADSYPVLFRRLIEGLCEAKYVVIVADQVGSPGKGTLVEKRSGGSFDETSTGMFQSSNWPEMQVPGDMQNSGTVTLDFQQTLISGHYHVSASATYDEPTAWSTGHWIVGGVAASVASDPIEWIHWYYCPEQDPPWCFWSFWEISPCGVPNEIPAGTELTDYSVNDKTIVVPWELEVTDCSTNHYWSYILQLAGTQTFTCEEHYQRAQNFWNANSWEEGEYSIGAAVVRDDGHWLKSFRGRIYANLTNFTGTARCYLSVAGGDYLIGIAQSGTQPSSLQPGDTPVATDLIWHFFQPVPTGTEWASDVMGDNIPPVADCDEQWDWYIIQQVIIVTPDFHNNIDDCEPCSACNGDQCTPGSISTTLTGGALNLNIALGRDSYGKPAGELSIYTLRPLPNLSAPSALAYHTSLASEALRDTNSALRQVGNSQTLADIVAIDDAHYEIRFYTAANAGTKNGSGFYVPTGSPFKTIVIANPDASGATPSQLRVTESADGIDRVSDFVWSKSEQKWSLETGNGLRKELLSSERASYTARRETYTIVEPSGQTVSYKEQRLIQEFGWGEEIIEKVVDPDGAALTTTWRYYDDKENDGNSYSHLKQVLEPSGYWERYQYDPLGRTIEVVSQYLDASLDASNDQCRVTTTLYGTNDPAVAFIETIQGIEVSRRYTAYRPGEKREIQALTPNAEWNDPGNLVTVTRTYLSGAFDGKTRSISRPDGTLSIYQYEYIAPDGVSNLVTTVSTGQPNGDGTAVINGTKIITAMNQAGTRVREEIYDTTDENDTLLTWNQAVAFDDFGRATQINYSDGTTLNTTYGCCGVLSTTDREGITTSYTYDDLKRLASTTRAGITTTNSYDAAGHILGTVRVGSDNSAITLNTSTYDVTGRLTSSTDALTNAMRCFEFIDFSSGHTIKSNVLANGSYRVEISYRDGQLESLIGSAVHGVRYEYGVDADGQYTKEIKLAAIGADTAEWTKTYTDMAGRLYKTIYADESFSQSFYNDRGQLAMQIDPDEVIALFAYNAKGELDTTAIDMNQNGQIDFGGTDRVTQIKNSIVNVHGTTVRRTTTSAWTTDNVDASSVVSVNDVSTDGLQSWSITYGLTNHVQTVYSGNGQRTATATNPDGSYTIAQYQDGQLVSNAQYGNDDMQVSATSYGYDPHGRLDTQTDARTGATMYGYNDADQLVSVTTPVPAAGQSAQTIQYEYDAMGRRTIVVLPDNGTVTTEYFDTGEPQKIYGVRTYPVEYTYDYAGRMKTMKTWKDYSGDSGMATTTWNYDVARGFLCGKVYDDSTSVTYSNSAAGRLLSRTWARGVVTSYDYNNAGDLGTITYSDSTPSVESIYDRRGRRTTVIVGANSSSYTYDDAGQILTESFPNSNVIVTNVYDGILRRSSLSGAAVSVAYSYDGASRLSSVTNGPHTATYTYVPNSPLVSNIIFATNGTTKMTTTKSYDNLNRLTFISSVDSMSSVVSSHSYLYSDANQRTRVDLVGGSYWIYGYDSLGQVTSGKKYWSDGTPVEGQQFEYGFDTIGNRTNAVTNGRTANYAPNNLNQYTQRTVPGYLDIFGTAASNATVTVNNHATARKGDYFHTTLQFSNTLSAIYTNISVVGVRKNAGPGGNDVVTEETGHEFLPKTPEIFGYDADGNLTNDGRWAYTWDGENRLVEMRTLADLPSSVPRQKLSFAYDFRSRRIGKVVSNWNDSVWVEISNLRFVYDGWNLITELDKTNGPVRSYTWGLDLSGTEEGAGGVGGLLAITRHQSPVTTHFVSYDGNGNVIALLDAQSATLSAQYEYSPFGETVRATGTAANLNLFRFSTKYTDETGLLYYGYRYYIPSTGYWLSRDPIEERGGLNLYAFIANNPVKFSDSLGLAQLWFFTGINNWQEGTRYTSIETVVRENWKYPQEANFEGPSHEFISDAGAALRYLWPLDEHPSLLVPWSEGVLDREAERMARRGVDQGALCCSRIRVLMIAPKTDTRPPRNACCSLETTVYWNPSDYVPNQGLLNPSGNEQYWEEWGKVHIVDTGKGHDFNAFIENARLPILQWNRQYLRAPGNLDSAGRWQRMYVPTGQNAPSPIDTYLRRWMNDRSVNHIFVCHIRNPPQKYSLLTLPEYRARGIMDRKVHILTAGTGIRCSKITGYRNAGLSLTTVYGVILDGPLARKEVNFGGLAMADRSSLQTKPYGKLQPRPEFLKVVFAKEKTTAPNRP